MLVKKVNPEWCPKENENLKVGETIEITDPKILILHGDVVGVGENGVEMSAYELYGVIVADERKDFEEYLKLKKQEELKEKLEADSAKLKEEVVEPAAATEVKVEEPVSKKK